VRSRAAADKALSLKVDRNAHVRQLLTKFQGTDNQAQQLAETASRPAEQSLFEFDAALLPRPDAAGGRQPPHRLGPDLRGEGVLGKGRRADLRRDSSSPP